MDGRIDDLRALPPGVLIACKNMLFAARSGPRASILESATGRNSRSNNEEIVVVEQGPKEQVARGPAVSRGFPLPHKPFAQYDLQRVMEETAELCA
jgi:hypothetical protein